MGRRKATEAISAIDGQRIADSQSLTDQTDPRFACLVPVENPEMTISWRGPLPPSYRHDRHRTEQEAETLREELETENNSLTDGEKGWLEAKKLQSSRILNRASVGTMSRLPVLMAKAWSLSARKGLQKDPFRFEGFCHRGSEELGVG